jgi:uncharacterized membrane protein
MRNLIKIGSILVMVVMLASFAMAFQKPAVQQAGMSSQLVAGGTDVITASDAGGGYLSTRDILLVILIVLALVGLGVLL